MAHPIQNKISEREAQIRELQGQIAQLSVQQARLEAEINAYRDALRYIEQPAMATPRRSTSSIRKSSVGDTWRRAIAAVSKSGNSTFSTDDVMSWSDVFGENLQRATVRAQCANFVKAGYLERIRNGVFSITDEGRSVFLGNDQPKRETAGDSLGVASPAAVSETYSGG